MTRAIGLILALVAIMATLAAPAHAETRRALLIGIKNYAPEVGPLDNPHKDVDLMASALRDAGFEVEVLKDSETGDKLGRGEILSRVRAHARAVADEPDAVSLLYYSGHGAANEEDNRNYIIPQDVTTVGDADLWADAVKLDEVLDRLQDLAPSAAHFVVFDACRNELALRSGTRALNKGFAVEPDRGGLFIAFSTAPGTRASDGESDAIAGPYATVLADELRKGGRRHSVLFEDVKFRVDREFGQTPWESNGLLRIVYLNGRDGQVVERPALEVDTGPSEGGVVETSAGDDTGGPVASLRKALVISNADYDEPLIALPNAHTAAEEVAAAMQGTGFDVTHVKNPSRDSLITEFIDLYQGFDGTAFEKLAVVYYIGHARAVDETGPNYLIPANAPVRSALDLRIHGVDLGGLLDRTGRPDDVDTVMVVDSCQAAFLGDDDASVCAPEEERAGVLLNFAAPAEPEAGMPSGDAPAREATYAAVFSDQIVKGGAIAEAIELANDKQLVANPRQGSAVSGRLERNYDLRPVTDSQLAAIKRAPELEQRYLIDRPTGAYAAEVSYDTGDQDGCFKSIQGKIAWNTSGSKTWNDANVRRLCGEANSSRAPGVCFKSYLDQAEAKGWSTNWQVPIALCAGVEEPNEPVACFDQTAPDDQTRHVAAARACAS